MNMQLSDYSESDIPEHNILDCQVSMPWRVN